MNADLDGILTKTMIGEMHGMMYVCENICLSVLKAKVIVIFLEMFP